MALQKGNTSFLARLRVALNIDKDNVKLSLPDLLEKVLSKYFLVSKYLNIFLSFFLKLKFYVVREIVCFLS